MYACLFGSSASLANIGPSLPVVLCLLLVTTFSTLSISLLVVADHQPRITALQPKLFIVVLMSVAIVFAVAFFLLPGSVIFAGHGHRDAGRVSVSRGQLLATFVRQNVVVVGILLFYVIRSVPDLLRVINESTCWQVVLSSLSHLVLVTVILFISFLMLRFSCYYLYLFSELRL